VPPNLQAGISVVGAAAKEVQMKRLLTILGVLAIGLTLATPVMAGHRDRSRGHHRHVRHQHHRHFVGVPAAVFHHGHRVRSSFFVGFGFPGYGYADLYAPAPFYCGSPAVILPAPVWVPGHYVYEDGVRFYIAGRWSR
jgi:hypothetical protein